MQGTAATELPQQSIILIRRHPQATLGEVSCPEEGQGLKDIRQLQRPIRLAMETIGVQSSARSKRARAQTVQRTQQAVPSKEKLGDCIGSKLSTLGTFYFGFCLYVEPTTKGSTEPHVGYSFQPGLVLAFLRFHSYSICREEH